MKTRTSGRALVVALALIACSNTRAAAPISAMRANSVQQIVVGDLSNALTVGLTSRAVPILGPLTDDEQAKLVALYGPRPGVLWTDGGGRPTDNVDDLLVLLEGSAADGLNPAGYRSSALRQLARGLAAGGPTPVNELAAFDLAMSAAALRYLNHLHAGRVDPATLRLRLHVPADRHDLALVLRTALQTHGLAKGAAELIPRLGQYRDLRVALARYRTLAADERLPAGPAFSTTVHPGDSLPAATLRDLTLRLAAFDDWASGDATTPATYDGPIVDAVKHFQLRHGLEPDGIIGRATQAALAVPLSARVRQIELALERLRWLPDLTNERVIALNIPMFRLWAWDAERPEGVPAFTTRAIVGRALRTQTPVFVEELREIVFRPFWNVPRSILRSEILPEIRKDVGYLDRQGMEIVQGPGDDARPLSVNAETIDGLAAGTLRLRQRPGPRNALGLVKFVFPNDDNVYLHSTPAQELFSEARRDFSHGCVRVEDPTGLAEWVLKDRAEWTRGRIVAAMSGAVSRRVTVDRPVEVVLFYLTAAVVPEDGSVHFADDIYGHDTVLDRALRVP